MQSRDDLNRGPIMPPQIPIMGWELVENFCLVNPKTVAVRHGVSKVPHEFKDRRTVIVFDPVKSVAELQ